MSSIRVAFGGEVITSDGLAFGKIHQLVVAPKNRSLPAIIVRYGHLPSERDFIVGWQLIDRVEEAGVFLHIDGKQVESLPEVIRAANVSGGSAEMPYIGSFGTAGAYASSDFIGDAVRAGTPVVGEGGAAPVGSRTAFDMSSTNIEIQTNLPEESIMASQDTDVVTSDEHKLGKLHEVICDESGKVLGFFARSGRFRHRELYVPVDLAAGGSHRYIRLSISGDEAEKTLTADVPS